MKDFFKFREDINEILGFGKAASKAKKGVQRAADKVTGGDSSGDKAEAEKIKSHQLQIKDQEKLRQKYEAEIKKLDDRVESGDITREKADDLDDYYRELEYKASQKIEAHKDQIKSLQKK